MPAFIANPGFFTWAGPRPGSFRPEGRQRVVGDPYIRNPTDWEAVETHAARIIVGFNVGTEPRWSLDDLIPLVKSIREQQTSIGPGDPGHPDASFIAQKGIYRHRDPKLGVVVEDGAQVIIIDTQHVGADAWKTQMIELAEKIAAALEQEQVIVEIQKNGQSVVTIGVRPY